MNTVSTDGAVPVTLVAGEEASGLANIISQYLDQLLADSPDKQSLAAKLRGRLGFHAREGNVSVTITFRDGGVFIEDGLLDPEAIVSGELEMLMHVLSGRANPAVELRRGTISVLPSITRPYFGYQAYNLMRLPGVRPWSGIQRPPLGVIASTGVFAGALVIAWRLRHKS